jgi:formylglycine-generating enzyme required for sulfatase activity
LRPALAAFAALAGCAGSGTATDDGQRLESLRLLGNAVLLEDAKQTAATLFPSFPEQVPALQAWLRDFAGPLQQRLPLVEQALAVLRARALPQTAGQQQAERQSHPRSAELTQLQAQLACWEGALAVREGRATLTLPALDDGVRAQTAAQLVRLAAPAVDLARATFGREAEALAMLRLALQKLDQDDDSLDRPTLLATLAQACHACGLDGEAAAHSRASLAACRDIDRPRYAALAQDLERSIDGWRGDNGVARIRALREWAAALSAEIGARREWSYADASDRFLDRMLARLAADLRAFTGADGECADVRARLADAETVHRRSIDDPSAEWRAAIAAIAAEPRYGGLVIAPQLGLVPLGPDPATRLWEFVHLASGAPGREFPERDAGTGRLQPTGEMGVVFLLLPGGTFTMGAQALAKEQPNHDPQAQANELPHAVTLAPFFLSKYEMTQGQWSRLWHGDAGLRFPSQYRIGTSYRGMPGTVSARHPVENVSWEMCEQLTRQAGLLLPTEAQWEYGCRAGTTTPWYTGATAETLAGHANLLDYDAVTSYPDWGVPEAFLDGFAGPAPVGHYPGANPFGLSDVHGNVWEWCRDCLGDYDVEARDGDGLRQPAGAVNRVHRGGAYRLNATVARSAFRFSNAPSTRNFTLGLRPARNLFP